MLRALPSFDGWIPPDLEVCLLTAKRFGPSRFRTLRIAIGILILFLALPFHGLHLSSARGPVAAEQHANWNEHLAMTAKVTAELEPQLVIAELP